MKYRSLESLRGIAALLVALFHSNFVVERPSSLIAQSSIFVDFFFILSGFVLYLAYSDKILKGLSFKKFIILRFGRVYPLHLFMLFIWLPVILIKAYLYHELGMGNSDPLVANNTATFISNLFLTNSLGLHDDISWNYPAWSISVEFFTYIIFFLFVVVNKQSHRPANLLLVSILSYIILYSISGDSLLRTFDYGILRCIGGFFLGAFLFSILKNSSITVSPAIGTILEFLSVSLALLLVVMSGKGALYEIATFIVFAIVIYVFTVQERGALSLLLATKGMLFLGTLSYSIYMTHALVFSALHVLWEFILDFPAEFIENQSGEVIKVFNTPFADGLNFIALIIIIAISYLTYTFVEKPWRDKFRAIAAK